MLTFPLKFSPNKNTSPVRPTDDKSRQKIAQKFNPELNKDFQAKMMYTTINKLSPK